MPIQAVVFEKSQGWTMPEMLGFLKRHNIKPMKAVHSKPTQWRWRITPPTLYSRFFTRKLTEGGKEAQIIIGII